MPVPERLRLLTSCLNDLHAAQSGRFDSARLPRSIPAGLFAARVVAADGAAEPGGAGGAVRGPLGQRGERGERGGGGGAAGTCAGADGAVQRGDARGKGRRLSASAAQCRVQRRGDGATTLGTTHR